MAENEWDQDFKDSEKSTKEKRAGLSKLKFDEAELKKTCATPIEEKAMDEFITEVKAATSAQAQRESFIKLGKVVGDVVIKAARKAIFGGMG